MGHLSAKSKDLVVESSRLLAKDFDEGLDGTSAMEIHGDLNDVGQARVHKLLDAGDWGHLDELLAKVVAKLVSHDVGHNFEHHMD